jgi:hypothetical protein
VLIAEVLVLVIAAGCGGGRGSALWSAHDKAGGNHFCTTRAHLPATWCACYQRVFQNAGKTDDQIHKAVLNAPSLATPPPQDAEVFQSAARSCR